MKVEHLNIFIKRVACMFTDYSLHNHQQFVYVLE